MYNSYLADKIARENHDRERKQNSIKHWVDNYYQKVQPHLLIKYNKRINSFIRKMEENPITMKTQQSQLSNMQKLFRNVYEKDSFIGDQSFKFKDSDDWKSFYTPGQRLQRQKNMKIFKEKFGDANSALRSIGSQSAYVSSAKKQFRVRQKSKQINPPMKYTTKSFNRTMAGTNYKLKKNIHSIDPQFEQLNRRNTSSSIGNFLQDDLHSQNFSIRQHSLKAQSIVDNDDDQNIEMIRQKQLQNDDKKMHFKRMIDIQQTVTDKKTKKSLREILIKCGIYRNKDRKAVTEVQGDKFQQLQK